MDHFDRQRMMRERMRKRESAGPNGLPPIMTDMRSIPTSMTDMRRKSFAPGKVSPAAHQDFHHQHRGAGNEDASDGTAVDTTRKPSVRKSPMPMGRTRASIRAPDMFGDGLFAAEAEEPLKGSRQSGIMVGSTR